MSGQDFFCVVAVQPDVYYCTDRNQILEKNLKRHLELIDFMVPLYSGNTGAPCKLVVFPEFALHGIPQRADGSWNGVSIDIPGEETELLGKKAKELNIYIASHGWTEYPDFRGRPFSVAFLIGPDGKVVLRHHKVVTSKTGEAASTAPGDAYDWFVEKFGDGLDAFFPVADTEIGKVGFIICGEGMYPEIGRGLMMNGAEILIRPNAWIEPHLNEPQDWMALCSRFQAFANMCYLVEANWARYHDPWWPKGSGAGRSQVIDYAGRILTRAYDPGEAGAGSEINIQSLRRYREGVMFGGRMVYMPMHIFRKVYDTEIWPKNTLMEKKESGSFQEWESIRQDIIETRKDIYFPSKKT